MEGDQGDEDVVDFLPEEDVQRLVSVEDSQWLYVAVGNSLVQVGLVEDLLVAGAYNAY